MTTTVAALRAIESGEPHALRVGVEALGVALAALAVEASVTEKINLCGIGPAALKHNAPLWIRANRNRSDARLFPLHSAMWSRAPNQTTGEFVQAYRPWNWWFALKPR